MCTETSMWMSAVGTCRPLAEGGRIGHSHPIPALSLQTGNQIPVVSLTQAIAPEEALLVPCSISKPCWVTVAPKSSRRTVGGSRALIISPGLPLVRLYT